VCYVCVYGVCVCVVCLCVVCLCVWCVCADEMQALISENTMSGQTGEGSNFHVFHGSDGTMKGRSQGGYDDSGTWEVTARGEYCRRWKEWRDGDRDCFIMYSLDDNKYRLVAIGKSYQSLFVIQPGDQRAGDYLPESVLNNQPAPGSY